MALTPSNMIELGIVAPDFSLPDVVSGRSLSFSDVAGPRGTLVMFICNHCPYVKHINTELVNLGHFCESLQIGVVAISANDADKYPEDSPEAMKAAAIALGYPFAYLHDASQQVARAYDAACTPDFFLFDADGKLAYRGRLDDSTPGNGKPVTGKDLRTAIGAVAKGEPAPTDQHPSMGCNIKWKR